MQDCSGTVVGRVGVARGTLAFLRVGLDTFGDGGGDTVRL